MELVTSALTLLEVKVVRYVRETICRPGATNLCLRVAAASASEIFRAIFCELPPNSGLQRE